MCCVVKKKVVTLFVVNLIDIHWSNGVNFRGYLFRSSLFSYVFLSYFLFLSYVRKSL